MSERRGEETAEPILAIIILSSAPSTRASSALGGRAPFLPREFRPSSHFWCGIILSSLCVFPVAINSLQFGFEKHLPVGTVCLFEIGSHSVSQAGLGIYRCSFPPLSPERWTGPASLCLAHQNDLQDEPLAPACCGDAL